MNERGLLTSFLVCKVGVTLAAMVLLCAVFSMYAGIGRVAEREDLAQVADAVAGAIEAADSIPGEMEMRRSLPAIPQQFELVVTGEQGCGVEVVRVRVIAEEEVERVLMLMNPVNGGEFTLAAKNPSEIHLVKSDAIQMEVV